MSQQSRIEETARGIRSEITSAWFAHPEAWDLLPRAEAEMVYINAIKLLYAWRIYHDNGRQGLGALGAIELARALIAKITNPLLERQV